MLAPAGDGATQREHLVKAADGLLPDKAAIDKLESEPALPPLGADLWASFQELHSRRDYAEYGPVRFAWRDIEAYSAVTRTRLDNFALRMIFALEDAFFTVLAETNK